MNNYKKLILKLRLLSVFWSITFLSVGIAFVYASLYECASTEFDIILKTYSVGGSIVGILISTIFSFHTFFYRKKYERTSSMSS
jgi:hypothetical protein